jgi:hypothetical protein
MTNRHLPGRPKFEAVVTKLSKKLSRKTDSNLIKDCKPYFDEIHQENKGEVVSLINLWRKQRT